MEKAYVVPHPPIILPEVGRGEEEKISQTIQAYKKVAQEIAVIQPQTIIISSPHAPYYRDAFYLADATRAKGDLRNFGVFNVEETVEIDRGLAKEICDVAKDLPIYYAQKDASDLDHGSLIPLRFIKAVYSDFQIIRLGLSTLSSRDHYKLGMAIEEAAQKLGRKCVYIASGDLSHVLKETGPYGYRKEGPAFDRKIVDILERAAFDELIGISHREADAAAQCGLGSFQIMAGTLDGRRVKAEKYAYEGPFGVGYAVVAFSPEADDPERAFLTTSKREKPMLDPYIELAKKSMQTYIKQGKLMEPPADLPEEMMKHQAGCFVSLHKFGKLRGCIGTIAPTRENIAKEIINNAISAATTDPRFPAVGADELNDLVVSVDILGEPEPIDTIAELDPKKYGVIVTSGFKRGLLLPNLEGVDTAKYQVSIALQKAGIRSNEDYKMERFQVIRHEYDN